MPVQVHLSSDNVLAVRAPFYLKDACKAIPGARWNKDLKMWVYPPTPSAARAIFDGLTEHELEWSPTAADLLVEADRMDKAAAHKTAEHLPTIKISKGPRHWNHQKQAYWFAQALPGVMLAMDMSTGKSRVVVDLIQNKGWMRTLIICPKAVAAVWPDEIEKYSAVPIGCLSLEQGTTLYRSREIKRFLDLQRARLQAAVIILNYDVVWRDAMAREILSSSWDAVVCDESHRIKAPGGKAAMFVSKLGDRVPNRICLTGTPMPHSPLDAYAQYRFLDKGIYGTSFTNFRAKYAVIGGYLGKQVQGFQNQDELQKKFYSIAFRVMSDDVHDLPETLDVTRPVILSAYAQKLYKTLKAEFVVDVDNGTVTAGNALTRLLRLQQIGSGWARKDRNIETGAEGELLQIDTAKQDALADLMEDLKDEEPLVVFCRFHHDLDAVHTVAAALGRTSSELSGRTNQLAAWQSGSTPVLAVQIQSGGVGINLVRARYCVFYSLGFSLGEYLQARKRIHRPGQAHNCTYYHLIAKGTVDEQVYQALENRLDVVETILKQVKT